MNNKSINRNVWALTLGLCLGIISYSTFSVQAADAPKADEKRKFQTLSNASKITGKVTQVDATKKTFTIVAKGQPHTFSAARLKALPKVGEVVDVEYTDTGTGGPLESINLNSSRSNIY
jgi:hypothetical protein